MGWYWEIARNDGQRCLHVVDTAKNTSVMELLPKQITTSKFIDLVIDIGEKTTSYDYKNMVRRTERSRHNIKGKLLLWNAQFETAWDIARGFYYIQMGLCPNRLVTSYGRYADENIHTEFAVVYLDSDARTFWALSTDDAYTMLYDHSFDTEDDGHIDELRTLMSTIARFADTTFVSTFEYIMEKRLKEVEKIFKEQGQEASNIELKKFMSKLTLEEVFVGLDSKRLKENPTSYRTLLRCWELSLKRLQEGKKTRVEVTL